MGEWSLSPECSRHSTPHTAVPHEPGLHQQGGPGHGAKTQSPDCVETRPCGPSRLRGSRSKATGSGHGWADSRRAANAFHADARAAGKQDSPSPVTHSLSTCWRTMKHAGLLSALFMRGPGPRGRSCPRAHSFCLRLPHGRVELHTRHAGEGLGCCGSESSARHPLGGNAHCSQETCGDLELGAQKAEGLSGAKEAVRPWVMASVLRVQAGRTATRPWGQDGVLGDTGSHPTSPGYGKSLWSTHPQRRGPEAGLGEGDAQTMDTAWPPRP